MGIIAASIQAAFLVFLGLSMIATSGLSSPSASSFSSFGDIGDGFVVAYIFYTYLDPFELIGLYNYGGSALLALTVSISLAYIAASFVLGAVLGILPTMIQRHTLKKQA